MLAGTVKGRQGSCPRALPRQWNALAPAQRSGRGAGPHPQKVPQMAGRAPGISPHRLSWAAAFQCHLQLMISGGDVKAVQGTTGHASADMLVNTYAHIQQTSRKELGQKFEESFYKEAGKPAQPSEIAGEAAISMSALLDL